MASALAMVMKRLLQKEEITKEQVKERVASGKLTEADYKYITGETYAA